MRTIFLIHIFLFFFLNIKAQCYDPLYEKGKEAFASKSYNEAISSWQDAKQCPDAPKTNDIASKIQEARREIAALQEAKKRDVQNKLDAQRREEQEKEERRRRAEEAKILNEQRKADAEQRRLQREAEQRRLEEEEQQRRLAEEAARLARAEQLRIQEENDFKEAKRINTDESYLSFMEKYPYSRRIDDINQGFIDAYDDRLWKALTVDRFLIDYEKYLKLLPTGLHAEEAKKAAANIRATIPTMIDIKGGKFIMGSSEGRDDEKPIDEIIVGDIEMSKTEITVAQFATYIEETKDSTDAERRGFSCVSQSGISKNREKVNWRCDVYGNTRAADQYTHPVLHVSWNDVNKYCAWLRKKTGRYFRLPYEAEWEYAAGNGVRHTKYSWGDFTPFDKNGGNLLSTFKDDGKDGKSNDDVLLSKVSFETFKDGFISTAPVGSYETNEFGLYDMTGNVWEWCGDYYDATFYNTKPVYKNPKGNLIGTLRVIRGGGWTTSPYQARVTCRNSLMPEMSNYFTGFRIVVSK